MTATKNCLATALRQLMSEVPLEKITVQQIAERAGVSRKTFYYHFQDIIDLIEWILNEDRRQLLPSRITDENWKPIFMGVLSHCLREQAVLRNLYASVSRDVLESYIYSVLKPLVLARMAEDNICANLSAERRGLLADLYIFSMQGVLLRWLDQGMRTDPAQLVDDLDFLTNFVIRRKISFAV